MIEFTLQPNQNSLELEQTEPNELDAEVNAQLIAGVSKKYVDTNDTRVLNEAKEYTDTHGGGMTAMEKAMFDVNLSCFKSLLSDLNDAIFMDGEDLLYIGA